MVKLTPEMEIAEAVRKNMTPAERQEMVALLRQTTPSGLWVALLELFVPGRGGDTR